MVQLVTASSFDNRVVTNRRNGAVHVLRKAAAFALVFGLGSVSASASGPTGAEPIPHPMFDANHCLTGIERSARTSTVVMRWGCGTARFISMSCVFDRSGYGGLGPKFAKPGWHCNYPLPVLAEDGGERASDLAVGDVSGAVYWAACFVASYGDFAARDKPYHRTPCWKALRDIGRAVKRSGRSPADVAGDLLP